MIDQLKPLIGKLSIFAKDRMGFEHPPKLFLKSDAENSQMALGRTAHYDPNEQSVTLFVSNRHPKDILRSLAHELVHHTQNLRGDLNPEKMGTIGKNYAQDNDHMRNMEKEAYLKGNMCFRDWEDSLDNKELFTIKLAESKFLKENKTMTTKITKKFLRETIRKILNEREYDLGDLGGGVRSNIGDKRAAEASVRQMVKLSQVRPSSLEKTNPRVKAASEKQRLMYATKALQTAIQSKDPDLNTMAAQNAADFPSLKDSKLRLASMALIKKPSDSINTAAKGREGDMIDGLKNLFKGQFEEGVEEEDLDEGSCGSGSRDDDEDVQEEAADPAAKPADDKDPPAKEDEKPDIGDIDKDGNKKESAKGAAKDAKKNESKIQTPEQENTLYENRFAGKNERLYQKLIKEWAK